MKTANCFCGGETQVEYFDHPRLENKWFLICLACSAMSKFVKTADDAENLVLIESTT